MCVCVWLGFSLCCDHDMSLAPISTWNETSRLICVDWRNMITCLFKFRASELENGASYKIPIESVRNDDPRQLFFGTQQDIPVCNIEREFSTGKLDDYVILVRGVDNQEHKVVARDIRLYFSNTGLSFFFFFLSALLHHWLRILLGVFEKNYAQIKSMDDKRFTRDWNHGNTTFS